MNGNLFFEPASEEYLKVFYKTLHIGKTTFRYYEKRDFGVIKHHLCTLLLFKDHHPIGYGHLDPDGDITWLGVAVSDDEVGRGFGKKIILELLRIARDSGLQKIQLSVDIDNTTALALYQRLDFKIKETLEKIIILEHKLS